MAAPEAHDEMEAALLALVQQFMNERAHAAAHAPDEYPGTIDAAPTVAFISTTHEHGDFTGWFVADFMIRYGGQAGSDRYLHVVEVGHAVLGPDVTLAEAVVEKQHLEHASEWDYEWAPPEQRYDRQKVRDQVVGAWWPPLSAMP